MHSGSTLCCRWTTAFTLCGDHPASDAIVPAPLPAAARHLPLAGDEGEKASKKKFKQYPIGFFHIDIAEVRTEEGKLYLFVAIDRTSKIAFAKLVDKANTAAAKEFLDALVQAIPYKINVVLTDNGIQFADLPKNRSGPTAMLRGHPFDRTCRQHDIEHRLTKPNHPSTNGQVERMNRTLKEATINATTTIATISFDVISQTSWPPTTRQAAQNPQGLTPHEYVCKISTSEPERFSLIHPAHFGTIHLVGDAPF